MGSSGFMIPFTANLRGAFTPNSLSDFRCCRRGKCRESVKKTFNCISDSETHSWTGPPRWSIMGSPCKQENGHKHRAMWNKANNCVWAMWGDNQWGRQGESPWHLMFSLYSTQKSVVVRSSLLCVTWFVPVGDIFPLGKPSPTSTTNILRDQCSETPHQLPVCQCPVLETCLSVVPWQYRHWSGASQPTNKENKNNQAHKHTISWTRVG